MSIVSSSIVIQRDDGGFWYVEEEHTDNIGGKHKWRYTPTKAVDLNAVMAQHAAVLAERLANEEIEDCIELNVLLTNFNTKAELAAKIRELYREAEWERLFKIARWIRARIQAGDFTEAQVQNAFGLTNPQWNTLKTKFQNYDDALTLIETAAGE